MTKHTKKLSYVLITAARNEEAFIDLTIKSIIAQTILPKKWIIASDGSTDNTTSIAEKYPVKIITQKNQGPAAARNRGADEAKGHILIFTDSDCELDFNFIEKIITPIEKDVEVVGVQGSYRTKQTQFMARFGQVCVD